MVYRRKPGVHKAHYKRKRNAYRRKRKINFRRRALARLGNVTKFYSKSYEQSVLKWDFPDISVSNADWQRYQRYLNTVLFYDKNSQFIANMNGQYQWVKFNYIAIKVKSISYYAYTSATLNPEGQVVQLSGMSAIDFTKLKTFFATNIEEDFGWNKVHHFQVDPESLSQYPGAKSITSTSRKGITFMYKFPAPWRQFFSTYAMRNALVNPNPEFPWTFNDCMQKVSGVSNLRVPSLLMGTHQSPFLDRSNLPTDLAGIKGHTVIELQYYLGCTFRGRGISGVLADANSALIF